MPQRLFMDVQGCRLPALKTPQTLPCSSQAPLRPRQTFPAAPTSPWGRGSVLLRRLLFLFCFRCLFLGNVPLLVVTWFSRWHVMLDSNAATWQRWPNNSGADRATVRMTPCLLADFTVLDVKLIVAHSSMVDSPWRCCSQVHCKMGTGKQNFSLRQRRPVPKIRRPRPLPRQGRRLGPPQVWNLFRFRAFKRLKPSAAASTRHSGHSYLGLPQPSATIAHLQSFKMLRGSFDQARRPQPLLLSAFEAAVCPPSNA